MAMRAKQGKTAAPGKKPSGAVRASQALDLAKQVREEYGLSLPLFARLIGVDKETLESWETGAPSALGSEYRIVSVVELLKKLTRAMPRESIAAWLNNPNDACRSAGVQTPGDLMERGRYDKIEEAIYFLESGTAF